MAALRLCSSVLRTAYRGGTSIPVARSSCPYNNLAKALQSQCFISEPRIVTAQQIRHSSFFNKCEYLKKEVKNVFNMTAKEGRKKSVSALVVVGNGNGVAGFALGKATDRMVALRKAKNRAIHYLHYIERYNDHTIYHDVTTSFKRTRIRMKKQNVGYGLHCHRAIITICKLLGIQDMYAKVSGSTNLLNLTRAFFLGLSKQETHQQLADKKGLYVVEFRDECGPLPRIVASPQGALRKDPEPEGEVPNTKLDWDEVKSAQGMKRSKWANVKRTIW
ncbi:28S ribosomal protein S5, mitochondrial [Bombina bombina]|uniref:28S ribosomal protein S5, mitochondrial n=1 Tax=Bombina bombina TaxID=8345 RepID=UPI00235B1C04|nr:28S ribosomal protein S5, mitochondrial [Bombina bombina]